MTINQAITFFNSSLSEFLGREETQSCARITLEKFTAFDRKDLIVHGNDELSQEQVDEITRVVIELKTGRPLQYILNEAWFYGLPFYVDDRVLIPRPETEELVELILSQYDFEQPKKVLDIGTGSGCIPVALSHRKPYWKIYGIDVSPGALEVAAINVKRNHAHVLLQMVDVLNESYARGFFEKHGPFDVIVSNPPYISYDEKTMLGANVFNFEPHLALFAHENDPLVFYRSINQLARQYLKEGGELYYEISEFKGNEMLDLMKKNHFNQVELIRDMSNKNRIIKAIK